MLTADAASAAGMPMEPLSPATQAELRGILPGFATTTNPVDITAALLSNSSLLGAILPAIARDPAADAFLVGIPVAGAGYDVEAFARATMLDEAASLQLLGAAGVPVVDHVACRTEAEALAAFESFGGASVVIKGCSPSVAHKSELGLVKVGVGDADSVARAWRDIDAAAAGAGIELSSVIVARMVKGQRELMIGARFDPVFGPVLLVGDGGKYVEAMPDSQVLLAPFDLAAIEAALRRLRIAPLLDGVRGEPALDVASFCAAALQVGRLMLDERAAVTNLDINPVIVGARGQGSVAVDAVVYRG